MLQRMNVKNISTTSSYNHSLSFLSIIRVEQSWQLC